MKISSLSEKLARRSGAVSSSGAVDDDVVAAVDAHEVRVLNMEVGLGARGCCCCCCGFGTDGCLFQEGRGWTWNCRTLTGGTPDCCCANFATHVGELTLLCHDLLDASGGDGGRGGTEFAGLYRDKSFKRDEEGEVVEAGVGVAGAKVAFGVCTSIVPVVALVRSLLCQSDGDVVASGGGGNDFAGL
jgi:hypothetical protein